MRNDIESALKNAAKLAVPNSTFAKVHGVLQNLEHEKGPCPLGVRKMGTKCKKLTMVPIVGKVHMKLRHKKSIVLAAAFAGALLISVTAAAATLWNRQQAKLRSILNIEGKDIPEYVEYSAEGGGVSEYAGSVWQGAEYPAENGPAAANAEKTGAPNVRVLSSIRNVDFVRYYISVSPITLEQAENYNWYAGRGEGEKGWKLATPAGALSNAYDEGGRSLLLDFSFMIDDLNETEPFKATLLGEDRRITEYAYEISEPVTLGRLRELKPDAFISAEFAVPVNIIDIAAVSVSFGDGVEFKNPQTGETGLILGAEINAGSFAWVYTYPGAARHYSEDGAALPAPEKAVWLNAFDGAVKDAVLVTADGGRTGVPATVREDFADGVIRAYAILKFPIELSALEGVIIRP